MFSKELEELIQYCLADGKLEDHEKAALVKRAEKEGVDVVELDIYINSILQKRRQTKTAEEDAREEKVYQEKKKAKGKLCPHCEAPLPPLAEKCPECGEIILTAAVNEKIERMMADIRNKYSQALGHKFVDSNDKNQVIGLLQDAKTQNLEMNMMYGSVQKVNIFCTQMGKDIDIAISEMKSKKTDSAQSLKWVGIIVAIMMTFGMVMVFVERNDRKEAAKEKSQTELINPIDTVESINDNEIPSEDSEEAEPVVEDDVEEEAMEEVQQGVDDAMEEVQQGVDDAMEDVKQGVEDAFRKAIGR